MNPLYEPSKVSAEEINKIRNAFFEECTININGTQKNNYAPHDLFEWFKPYLLANRELPTVTPKSDLEMDIELHESVEKHIESKIEIIFTKDKD
jgi:hypothetical protein